MAEDLIPAAQAVLAEYDKCRGERLPAAVFERLRAALARRPSAQEVDRLVVSVKNDAKHAACMAEVDNTDARDQALARLASSVDFWALHTPRQAREAEQRARMQARLSGRAPSAATADFDLPAPNDELSVTQETPQPPAPPAPPAPIEPSGLHYSAGAGAGALPAALPAVKPERRVVKVRVEESPETGEWLAADPQQAAPGPSTPLVELRALKFLEGRIVQVGRATQTKAHGDHCWLCEALPPLGQRFELVSRRTEAVSWLRDTCGAEEVLAGAAVD